MVLNLPKIYPITDTTISGLAHSEQIERLAAGGATLIQLREKRASSREFYQVALEAMITARRLGVRVIVNDRVDIAIAVGADGVHLGQDDLPPGRARMLLGENLIIGYSTHSLEQALAANSMPVDYVAIGPIFRTASKENPDPVVGVTALSEIRSQITKPLVAIGGITLQTVSQVLSAGADTVAIISDLLSAKDIAEQTRMSFQRSSQ
jgi:thiamine-phosphate pyrophosphorylase